MDTCILMLFKPLMAGRGKNASVSLMSYSFLAKSAYNNVIAFQHVDFIDRPTSTVS